MLNNCFLLHAQRLLEYFGMYDNYTNNIKGR